MAATEAAAEPEEEQEEADQMRDTDEGSAAEAQHQKPPENEMWSRAQRRTWKKEASRRTKNKWGVVEVP